MEVYHIYALVNSSSYKSRKKMVSFIRGDLALIKISRRVFLNKSFIKCCILWDIFYTFYGINAENKTKNRISIGGRLGQIILFYICDWIFQIFQTKKRTKKYLNIPNT